jgi:hypothetical protein
MLNKIVTVEIPEQMFGDFLDFLDSAQGIYDEEDLRHMEPYQRNLVMFIRRKLLPQRGKITVPTPSVDLSSDFEPL